MGLVLIGAGGHGKVVADTAEALGYGNITFVDDKFPKKLKNSHWDITNNLSTFFSSFSNNINITSDFFISIGDNHERRKIDRQLGEPRMPIIISPKASVSNYAKVSAGSLAVAGCSINTDCTIGRCVIINTSCSIDHDCVIENYVHVSPGVNVGGNVKIGENTWLGIGATVRNGITIGKNVMVGAGAVVVNDILDGTMVMGVPAKVWDKNRC